MLTCAYLILFLNTLTHDFFTCVHLKVFLAIKTMKSRKKKNQKKIGCSHALKKLIPNFFQYLKFHFSFCVRHQRVTDQLFVASHKNEPFVTIVLCCWSYAITTANLVLASALKRNVVLYLSHLQAHTLHIDMTKKTINFEQKPPKLKIATNKKWTINNYRNK